MQAEDLGNVPDGEDISDSIRSRNCYNLWEHCLIYEENNNVMMVYRQLTLKASGSILSITIRNSYNISVGNVKVALCCSEYLYTGIFIAISFLFRQGGISRPMEFMESLSLYGKVSKQKGYLHKQDLELRISEGTKYITMEVNKILTRKQFLSSKKEHIFAQFLLLNW